MEMNSFTNRLREYLFRKDALRFCSEAGKQYPNLKNELWDKAIDISTVSLLTNTFSLTGLFTTIAPYFTDAANPEPHRGWAIVMGLSAAVYSEFIRNFFCGKIEKELARYRTTMIDERGLETKGLEMIAE